MRRIGNDELRVLEIVENLGLFQYDNELVKSKFAR